MTFVKPKNINTEKANLLIDVRSPDEYLIEHIPGSQNIPLEKLPSELEKFKNQNEIIMVCRSGNRAQKAKEILESFGCINVKVLEGGLNEWKNSNLPVISMKKGFSIMQQVQIIAGSMVLIGTLIKPLWFLALIAGTGLLIAGLTNTCLMATLLSKLPWNKTSSNSTSCKL